MSTYSDHDQRMLDQESGAALDKANDNRPLTVRLSSRAEAELLIACVSACSPTGGGSSQYALVRKLIEQLGLTAPDELVGRMITTAHVEWVEWHDQM